MRPLIVALSVALVFILVIPTHSVAINPSKVAKSVTTLGIFDTDKDIYQPICTVSSINEVKGYWLTAAHCVNHGEQTYILEDIVSILELDAEYDLAILQTPLVSLPGLKLAKKAPQMGDVIVMLGYQGLLNMQGPIMTRGWVANTSLVAFVDEGWNVPFMILQIVGAPGNSGSAVLNTKDQIVSVLQWGFGRVFGTIAGGATYEAVSKYKKYWE